MSRGDWEAVGRGDDGRDRVIGRLEVREEVGCWIGSLELLWPASPGGVGTREGRRGAWLQAPRNEPRRGRQRDRDRHRHGESVESAPSLIYCKEH